MEKYFLSKCLKPDPKLPIYWFEVREWLRMLLSGSRLGRVDAVQPNLSINVLIVFY